ncbi:MAG TPA: TonB family protein [Pyrinomonadaceae bacterium]|nr:TonB family protein [Pyrinomonadaceae bacterium]
MKEKRARHVITLTLVSIVSLVATAVGVVAQSAPETDAVQKRLKRARALIAAHKLGTAAAELDALRNSTSDDAVRDVTRVMLMSVYLEDGDYMRAQNLLEETYKQRTPGSENSTRTYFALAGQAVNGARDRLSRYRSFGININDKELAQEASNDLDHMRKLLERVAEQAREICGQSEKHFDALGLLEEVANVRSTVARTKQDRLQWQREVADTRRKLAASDMRIASIGNPPVSVASMNTRAAANEPIAAPQPATSENHATGTSTHDATSAGQPVRVATPTATAPEKVNATPADAPAGPAASEQAVDVGSLLEKATQKVNPSYPQTAKLARITGVVKVFLELDEKGAVKSARCTDGPQVLRQAATEAAKRWKFRPTVIGGQPVRVVGFLNFNFTL